MYDCLLLPETSPELDATETSPEEGVNVRLNTESDAYARIVAMLLTLKEVVVTQKDTVLLLLRRCRGVRMAE